MRTEEAKPLVETDVEQSKREREAFDRFQRRVDELEPTAPRLHRYQGVDGTTLATGTSRAGTTTRDVRELYRRTVMALPHYEDVYSDTFTESVRSEFGVEMEQLLVRDQALSDALRRGVVELAGEAKRRRTEWLDVLDTERRSLERARELLTAVGRTLQSDTATAREELYRCEVLAAERQAVLQKRRGVEEKIPGETVFEHLYGEVDTTYPVLADIAELTRILRLSDDQSRREKTREYSPGHEPRRR